MNYVTVLIRVSRSNFVHSAELDGVVHYSNNEENEAYCSEDVSPYF